MSVIVADVDTSRFVADDGSLSADDWVITERSWFQQLKEAGEPIMSDPYLDVITKKQVVGISAPVFKTGTKEWGCQHRSGIRRSREDDEFLQIGTHRAIYADDCRRPDNLSS